MEVLDEISEIGNIRPTNEDACLCMSHPKNKNYKLLAVADGMGGKEYGEIASNYTLNKIKKWFIKKEISSINDNKKLTTSTKNLLKRINKELISIYGQDVLGTTLTLAIITKKNTHIFNIGDSRAYIYKNQKLIQVTEDDSDVWMYYKYGNVNKEDLRYFAMSNFINACIGLNEKLCKTNYILLENDYDLILLLTDGVTDLLTDKKISKIIKKSSSEKILSNIIYEALYIDQNLVIPNRLKRKYLANFIVPFKGRDNASGVIYTKN